LATEPAAYDADCLGARDLATAFAAHAVSHHQQEETAAIVHQEGVLIFSAASPRVRS
jgi:hypothetical protein